MLSAFQRETLNCDIVTHLCEDARLTTDETFDVLIDHRLCTMLLIVSELITASNYQMTSYQRAVGMMMAARIVYGIENDTVARLEKYIMEIRLYRHFD